MRIARIKIAGFKSFVDPTTLHLPGNLTGIVGPNGCGKSNIIDAMLWVMGESSAKQLRGDSMADVIFSGSNSRKPVGQASVELVFDNSDAAIGGQYASFAEISIKRTVGRDGQSNYYLNGTRCRRKDIIDVFLGTGLGARGGYSVIEQGMISRVVEAKPDELRSFLEEAAGISRYKERRRETENRIRHTQENLERVNDIREELGKQLAHLQRQAKAAEKYQELKQEQRRLEAEALAIRWREIDAQRQAQHQLILARENEVEAALGELRRIEAAQIELREEQSKLSAALNERQSEFYARSAEISRLEQTLAHNEERHQALSQELARARHSRDEALQVLAADTARQAGIEAEIASLTPSFEARSGAEEVHAEALKRAEQAAEAWQQAWDTFNQQFTDTSRAEHAEQVRIEMLTRSRQDAQARLSALQAERQSLDPGALENQLQTQLAHFQSREQELAALRAEQEQARAALQEARARAQQIGQQLSAARAEWQEQRGQHAALKALQEAALGRDQQALKDWLAERGLSGERALAEALSIEAGWERAAETALAGRIAALCGSGTDARLVAAGAGSAPTANLVAVDADLAVAPARPSSTHGLARLVEKISSAVALDGLLAGVFVAPDLEAAQAARGQLAAHESIVTPDGVWLGPNWVQVPGRRRPEDGVLARERQLEALRTAVDAAAAQTATLEDLQRKTQEEAQGSERRVAELATAINQRVSEAADLKSRATRQEGDLQQMRNRLQSIGQQIEELSRRAGEEAAQLAALNDRLGTLREHLQQLAIQREDLNARRRDVQQTLEDARLAWRRARDERHELALKLESLKSTQQSLALAIARNGRLGEDLGARCVELEAGVAAALAPQADLKSELDAALAARVASETALKAARASLDEFEQQSRGQEEQRASAEKAASERRRALEQARLDDRALQVRAQEQEERLRQNGHRLEDILAALPAEADETLWREKLEQIQTRIARLGPINLAAIDEFAQLSERKTYLDSQFNDLTQALATLDDAMRKIDKETRTRFKETFDQVNAGLQRLFPLLIGGGHAYLELTGEDLLETGVTVMARPPGKRNSTIHLLSGGEKAMTALAFVFALFELNPAPFCLLDEVDAPLDDANVVRLTEMLRQMSAQVQFLFVTHNKITMEIAEQLVGVTMEEPGVSRLVAVNMDEAVQLAATA
ncbi:MAG TPA: chromosome segregation protein SMC [Gammaproteobacteria bacterium]|nr:chromosome segregation protein SMC [Gammaproteobacteria bacterium]